MKSWRNPTYGWVRVEWEGINPSPTEVLGHAVRSPFQRHRRGGVHPRPLRSSSPLLLQAFFLARPEWAWREKMAGGGYRPDSVPRRAASIHLGRASPRGSSSLPGDLTHRSGMRGQAPLVSLFGLAPHGVYRALSVSGEAVRSYRTLSPLPSTDSRAVCSLRHFPSRYRGRALPGMPPVAESGPSSRAYAPADARLL